MKLDEHQTRAKVIELLDGMNQIRMDVWISSGIIAGVIDGAVFEKCMLEELPRRSHEVQEFWGGTCIACLSGYAHPN